MLKSGMVLKARSSTWINNFPTNYPNTKKKGGFYTAPPRLDILTQASCLMSLTIILIVSLNQHPADMEIILHSTQNNTITN